jgi:hypothetical protein
VSGLVDLAESRHRAVRDAVRWLVPNQNLPEPALAVAEHFERLAADLLDLIETDDPQLTRCLDTLTTAKDYAVRAKLADEALADASA